MRMPPHAEQSKRRRLATTSTWWIISALAFQRELMRVGANSNSGGGDNTPWDNNVQHVKLLSRIPPAPSQVDEEINSVSHASASRKPLIDHSNNKQPNWLQRALADRLLKPAKSLLPPPLRRHAKQQKIPQLSEQQQHHQQQQYQHVEVTKNQREENNKSNNYSSHQPETLVPPEPPSSSERQLRTDHENDTSSSSPPHDIITNPATSPPWASALLAALSPLLRGRRLITGIQLGLIALILQQVWKAAQEVFEEYTAELNGVDAGSFAMGGGALKPVVVETVIEKVVELQFQQIQQEQHRTDTSTTAGSRSDKNQQHISIASTLLPYVRLAQNLHAAGLPLLRSQSAHKGQISSVEQVLRSVTRTELALLQQCLWTPSPSSHRPAHGNHKGESSSPFSQIAGLSTVKERLLDLITLLRKQQDQHPPDPSTAVDDQQHDVASTLEDYSHLLFPSDSPSPFSFASTSTASSTLSGPIRAGILLYGPPGCGKTMLVKAFASAANMPCLVVSPSTILRKYVGDSNQQVRALFTLASKLGNCIICIDELDGFFRQRHDQEHDVTRDLKTEFLQWWDGMMVTAQANENHNGYHNMQNGSTPRRRPLLVVVGATNRPFDVDPAVLRRLPQSYYIGLPNTSERLDLLHQLIYRNRRTMRRAPTDGKELSPEQVAIATRGYTPSDLQQLLQTAVTMGPLRRMQSAMAPTKTPGSDDRQGNGPQHLTTQDVLNAMAHVRPTPLSVSYQRALDRFVQGNRPSAAEETREASGFLPMASKWVTTWGNFYHIGTLEMDLSSWNALQQVLFHLSYNNEDDDSDSDGDEPEARNDGHAPSRDESSTPQNNGGDKVADNDEEDCDDEDDDL